MEAQGGGFGTSRAQGWRARGEVLQVRVASHSGSAMVIRIGGRKWPLNTAQCRIPRDKTFILG
jgi:hypothetical protein